MLDIFSWPAWNRVGFFADGEFNLDAELADGDDRMTLDAFPANIFAGDSTNDLDPVGLGQRLVVDPAGQNKVIQIHKILVDTLTIVFTEPISLKDGSGDPVTLPVGTDIGFPPPTHAWMKDVSKIQVVGIIPAEDDRGNAVNQSAPNVDIILEMAEQPDGPWHVPDGLDIPAAVDMSTAVTTEDRVTSADVALPPLPYLRARVAGATSGAIFSLRIASRE